LNIFPSGEHDGGLVVVPQSHLLTQKAFEENDDLCSKDADDYVRMPQDSDFWVDASKSLHGYSHEYPLLMFIFLYTKQGCVRIADFNFAAPFFFFF
jgi:hypothetical protein